MWKGMKYLVQVHWFWVLAWCTLLYSVCYCSMLTYYYHKWYCALCCIRKGKKYLASLLVLNFALMLTIAFCLLIITINYIVSYVPCGKVRNILQVCWLWVLPWYTLWYSVHLFLPQIALPPVFYVECTESYCTSLLFFDFCLAPQLLCCVIN